MTPEGSDGVGRKVLPLIDEAWRNLDYATFALQLAKEAINNGQAKEDPTLVTRLLEKAEQGHTLAKYLTNDRKVA
jgi:hypothetical protein